MTKVNTSYTDFSYGELSPNLYGRYDLQAFYAGHKRVENFIIDSAGQARFRNGTYFSAEADSKAFLHPFVYDDGLAFILEFTDLQIRFFSADGIVESGGSPYTLTTTYAEKDLFQLKFAQDGVDLYITHPDYPPRILTYTSATSWAIADHAPTQDEFGNYQAISGVTKASPAVVTYTGADSFTNGQRVRITGVTGMTELNDEIFEIANVNTTSNTFQLSGIDSTGYTTYSSGGIIEPITEVDPPFLAADSYPAAVAFYENRLVYGGSNDYPARIWFSRSDDYDDFTVDDEADDGMDYTASGDGINIRWLRGTGQFLAIGAFGDVLQATGGIDDVITPSSISIRPSNSYGVDNIAPIGKNTNVFFMQNDTRALRSFEYKLENDSYIPVDRTLVSEHITDSGVTQLAYQDARPTVLWAVRTDGEFIGMTMEQSEGVSGWHRHTTDGEVVSIASLPREGKSNQIWLCVKRNIDGNDVYYIEYITDPVILPYRADFVTGDKTADDAAFQNMMFEAQKEYVFVDSCLSLLGDEASLSASATLAPASSSGTGVTFTASASMFSSSDVGRELWRKSVTGSETGRAVITAYTSATEVTCDIIEDFDSTDAIPAGEWYFTFDSISGLDHLEGKTVTIIADGGQHAQKTVTSGAIELDRQVSVIHVGLGYEGYIETNSLEGGGTNGTAQTKKKSVNAVGVRVLQTMFGKVGLNYYDLEQIYERTAAMRMDRPPLPFTGDKKIKVLNTAGDGFDGGWQRQKNVIISQDLPFPMQVQMIIPYMDVSNV